MSESGTFLTWRDLRLESVMRKADIRASIAAACFQGSEIESGQPNVVGERDDVTLAESSHFSGCSYSHHAESRLSIIPGRERQRSDPSVGARGAA
jgi:hypothetical protein